MHRVELSYAAVPIQSNRRELYTSVEDGDASDDVGARWIFTARKAVKPSANLTFSLDPAISAILQTANYFLILTLRN